MKTYGVRQKARDNAALAAFYKAESEALASALAAIVSAVDGGASADECRQIARTTLELAGSDRGG